MCGTPAPGGTGKPFGSKDFAAPELASVDFGPSVDRWETVGAEVLGADISGTETSGTEISGTDTAGTDTSGREIPGREAPPVESDAPVVDFAAGEGDAADGVASVGVGAGKSVGDDWDGDVPGAVGFRAGEKDDAEGGAFEAEDDVLGMAWLLPARVTPTLHAEAARTAPAASATTPIRLRKFLMMTPSILHQRGKR